MMNRMKYPTRRIRSSSFMYRFVGPLVVACMLLLTPHTARAAADDDDKIYDGRVEGYSSKMTVEPGSTALMWMLLIVMGGATVGVMFKNARRTHLD
jgi:hypothetical protein